MMEQYRIQNCFFQFVIALIVSVGLIVLVIRFLFPLLLLIAVLSLLVHLYRIMIKKERVSSIKVNIFDKSGGSKKTGDYKTSYTTSSERDSDILEAEWKEVDAESSEENGSYVEIQSDERTLTAENEKKE